jgi:hypothetical protein
VQLGGHNDDLSYWECSLNRPFDPWCERIPRGDGFIWALRSDHFEHLQSAGEVRGRAIPMIARLNGAQAVFGGAETLTFQSVGRIDDQGACHITVFAEANIRLRNDTMVAAAELRDGNGNLIPPPPPEPSMTQRWIQNAEENDDIADMLEFAGRANNWFDIYKSVELAKSLVGGRKQLRVLLGGSSAECERMWRTANSYRHARDLNRPPVLTTLEEARPLLFFIVRTVLESREIGRRTP